MAVVNIEGAIELTLEVAGLSLQVVTCTIEEALSETGRIEAEIASLADIDFEPLLEETATVRISIGNLPLRQFTYRLGEVRFAGIEDETLRYRLTLYPAFWFTRFDVDTRKFRDQPTEAIVSQVLGMSGVDHRFAHRRPSALRPYTTQYRESRFAFVSRLLEYEGYYYRFDDDGTMVIQDWSPAADEVEPIASFDLRETEGALAHGSAGVTAFSKVAEISSGKATVNDHDWKKPSTSLLVSAGSAFDTDLEIYDYFTGYRDPAIGAVLAQLRVDALSAMKRRGEGKSTAPWLTAGKQMRLAHSEAIDFSGQYLLVRVVHRYRAPTVSEPAASYENEFVVIPARVPFRPLLRAPRPVVEGNHTAMTRGPIGEEIHTDPYGRAKVQFHWDREAKGTDEDSRWMRVLQETSSSMVLARVGWEVVVGYMDGDPDRPVVLARDINGEMVPTYTQPLHKNMMTIKTESYPGKMGYNELRMIDSAGEMRMDWHAQHDLYNFVEHDRTERILNDHTHFVLSNVDRVVEKNQTVAIDGNETKDVHHDVLEGVNGNRTESIGGSETIQIGTNGAHNVQGNDSEKVGSLRLTMAGGGTVSIPGPKDLMKKLVTPALGSVLDSTAGEQLGGAGVAAVLGGSVTSAAAGVGQTAGKAALGALRSGEGAAGALSAAKASLGLPEGKPDIGAALKNAVPSSDQLLSMGKGMALDAIMNGTIMRDSRKRLTRAVGGAWVQLAGGSIMHGAGKLYTEVIGGAKLSLAAEGSVMQSASKFLVDTVGGLVLRKSKDDMSISSKRSVVTVGGMAAMESAEQIELRSRVIKIEGQQKVIFKSGGLTIELTPDKVTLAGNMRVKSGDTIQIAGSPDELTA